MKLSKVFTTAILILAITAQLQAQQKNQNDKCAYKETDPGFYKEILNSFYPGKDIQARKRLCLIHEGNKYPANIDDYKAEWHQKPSSQGLTGTCWCFSSTSFIESEVFRTMGKKIKLSEMFTVYWEYVERAKAFVAERGDVYFAEGSEAVSVLRIMKLYGAMPHEAYSGKPKGQSFHNHQQMFNEMNTFLVSVKTQQAWNESYVIQTIRSILDNYMGRPPAEFSFEGKEYSPKNFLEKVMKLNTDDYYSFISGMTAGFNEKAELVEADNWWHYDEYYNITLDDFMKLIDKSLENGFTINICGDVSEPGHDSHKEISLIPDFDIPSSHINQYSREYRLNNNSTTDDHCIHIVGKHKKLNDWFLIKDSGAGGFNGKNPGYRFFHRDYIRLKMMNIMIHKDAARDLLDNIIK